MAAQIFRVRLNPVFKLEVGFGRNRRCSCSLVPGSNVYGWTNRWFSNGWRALLMSENPSVLCSNSYLILIFFSLVSTSCSTSFERVTHSDSRALNFWTSQNAVWTEIFLALSACHKLAIQLQFQRLSWINSTWLSSGDGKLGTDYCHNSQQLLLLSQQMLSCPYPHRLDTSETSITVALEQRTQHG